MHEELIRFNDFQKLSMACILHVLSACFFLRKEEMNINCSAGICGPRDNKNSALHLLEETFYSKGQIKIADTGKPSTGQPLHSDDAFIQKAVRSQVVASRTPPFASPCS